MEFLHSKGVLVLLIFLSLSISSGIFAFKAQFKLPLRHQNMLRGNGAMTPYPRSFELKSQSPEDVKINAQIARLNAVAAKLRAEAADLEVMTMTFTVISKAYIARYNDRKPG